jgi:cell division protease FtsH
MAQALIKYETIDSKQLDELMARQPVTPPDDWVETENGSEDMDISAAQGEPEARAEASASDGSIQDETPRTEDPDLPESTDRKLH